VVQEGRNVLVGCDVLTASKVAFGLFSYFLVV
jgi:hypothetical protein